MCTNPETKELQKKYSMAKQKSYNKYLYGTKKYATERIFIANLEC